MLLIAKVHKVSSVTPHLTPEPAPAWRSAWRPEAAPECERHLMVGSASFQQEESPRDLLQQHSAWTEECQAERRRSCAGFLFPKEKKTRRTAALSPVLNELAFFLFALRLLILGFKIFSAFAGLHVVRFRARGAEACKEKSLRVSDFNQC